MVGREQTREGKKVSFIATLASTQAKYPSKEQTTFGSNVKLRKYRFLLFSVNMMMEHVVREQQFQ